MYAVDKRSYLWCDLWPPPVDVGVKHYFVNNLQYLFPSCSFSFLIKSEFCAIRSFVEMKVVFKVIFDFSWIYLLFQFEFVLFSETA